MLALVECVGHDLMSFFRQILLFSALAVLETSPDHHHQIHHSSADDRQIHDLLSAEINAGEGIAPADRVRQHDESSSKGRQVTRKALRLRQIRQRTHLRDMQMRMKGWKEGALPLVHPIAIDGQRRGRSNQTCRDAAHSCP